MKNKVKNVDTNEAKDTPVFEPSAEVVDSNAANTVDPNASMSEDQVEDDSSACTGTDDVDGERIAVDDLQAKISSLEDSLLRAKADYQNLQRRSDQERSKAVRFANAELIRCLLDVVDDFGRSIEASNSSEDSNSLADGLRLVYENFFKVLRTFGLEPIEALGEPFDPHVHEAMMQEESPDYPPETVIRELGKGYRLRERVLRPAKVVVSKAADAAQRADADDGGSGGGAPADE